VRPATLGLVVGLSSFSNSVFYFLNVWAATYLSELAPTPISPSLAFATTATAQAASLLTAPLWGWLSDRLDRACDAVSCGSGMRWRAATTIL
jgi:MFS family permease